MYLVLNFCSADELILSMSIIRRNHLNIIGLVQNIIKAMCLNPMHLSNGDRILSMNQHGQSRVGLSARDHYRDHVQRLGTVNVHKTIDNFLMSIEANTTSIYLMHDNPRNAVDP